MAVVWYGLEVGGGMEWRLCGMDWVYVCSMD